MKKVSNRDWLTKWDKGICAGKNSVVEYLVEKHGFLRLALIQNIDNIEDLRLNNTKFAKESDQRSFFDVDSLLEFVTKTWKQRWVMTDIWNEEILEHLLRRPFFILVSVDAPVSLRWKRFTERYVTEVVVCIPTHFVQLRTAGTSSADP